MRCRKQLAVTNSLIVAEAVMMGFGPQIGRQVAPETIYESYRQALAKGIPLLEVLTSDSRISAFLDRGRESYGITNPGPVPWRSSRDDKGRRAGFSKGSASFPV